MTWPISIERNGGWRHTNAPCLARTWRRWLFEWTVLGVTFGASLPRLRKGTPPDRPFVQLGTWPCGCRANGFGLHGLDCTQPLPPEWCGGMDP